MANNGWQSLSFGKVTKNFDSQRIPVRESDRRAGIYPYYGASGTIDYVEGFLFDGEYLLVAEDGENLQSRKTPIAFMAEGKFWVNNHAHIVQGNDLALTRFLFYFLQEADIDGFITGSAQPKLTQDNLNRIPVDVPSIQEQKNIIRILGALDDKIKTNRRMNHTLESMTQTLFKSWFVEFDPVTVKAEGRVPFGMKAETAALFPSEFQDSKLGAIPKGWEVHQINELTSKIQYGLTQSASVEKVGPKFLRITDIQGGRVNWSDVPYCRVSDQDYEKYKLNPGDIVVARTGASTGENIYLSDVSDSVFASYLVRFQFPELSTARLVGAFMRTNDYFDYVGYNLAGSAQPNANAQVLAGASLVVPTPKVAKRFAELVSPFDKRIAQNDKEISSLTSIRDTLLPKLLSGELRVKQAEKVIEDM